MIPPHQSWPPAKVFWCSFYSLEIVIIEENPFSHIAPRFSPDITLGLCSLYLYGPHTFLTYDIFIVPNNLLILTRTKFAEVFNFLSTSRR